MGKPDYLEYSFKAAALFLALAVISFALCLLANMLLITKPAYSIEVGAPYPAPSFEEKVERAVFGATIIFSQVFLVLSVLSSLISSFLALSEINRAKEKMRWKITWFLIVILFGFFGVAAYHYAVRKPNHPRALSTEDATFQQSTMEAAWNNPSDEKASEFYVKKHLSRKKS